MTDSQDTMPQPQWQILGEEKRREIHSLLPEQWKAPSVPPPPDLRDATKLPRDYLSSKEVEITEVPSVAALLDKISKGELSAVEVVKAFCHRATIAHQVTNCLSEVLFDRAIADAQALDDEYKSSGGRVVGPLHGLPVSLKDQFRVRDAATSLGYVAWLDKKETAESESWLVQKLRSLGAVVYVKTNVPTSLMAIETNNNIVGYTLNAANRLLSSGGSSGGEAALIAMGGSIIGLGSDLGASIRLPAAFNGIVGHRPSNGRLPYLGVANSMLGHETMESVIGPMGRTIQDLQFFMKTLLQSELWKADPKVLRLPWREQDLQDVKTKISTKTLTFGVLRSDDSVTPHPPVRRVIDEAIEKLEAASYEVTDWDPPSHAEAYGIAWEAFTADAGTDIHTTLSQSGEPPVPELAAVYGQQIGHLPPKTINDYWANQLHRYEYQTRYLQYWESASARTRSGTPVDALIVPVAPTVGYEPTKGIYAGYTAVFSVLDYSVVVIHGGRADAARDVVDAPEQVGSLGELDDVIRAQYDPSLFHGSPIGIQIVCKRLEEEKVLEIAAEVERVMNKGIL